MKIQDVIQQCDMQIALTPAGVVAIVTFMIPGSASGNKKKLINAPGAPFGRIVAEYEKSCLCAFEAVKVKEFATNQLQLLDSQ